MVRSSVSSGKRGSSGTSEKSTTRKSRTTAKGVQEPQKTQSLAKKKGAEVSHVESEAVTLCRAFKKAMKDGTVDDKWDEIGDHYVYTFRNLKPAVACVTRYEEGRKKKYELHLHTESDIELDVSIVGFDYEHRGSILKLIFDTTDGHKVSFRKDYEC